MRWMIALVLMCLPLLVAACDEESSVNTVSCLSEWDDMELDLEECTPRDPNQQTNPILKYHYDVWGPERTMTIDLSISAENTFTLSYCNSDWDDIYCDPYSDRDPIEGTIKLGKMEQLLDDLHPCVQGIECATYSGSGDDMPYLELRVWTDDWSTEISFDANYNTCQFCIVDVLHPFVRSLWPSEQ